MLQNEYFTCFVKAESEPSKVCHKGLRPLLVTLPCLDSLFTVQVYIPRWRVGGKEGGTRTRSRLYRRRSQGPKAHFKALAETARWTHSRGSEISVSIFSRAQKQKKGIARGRRGEQEGRCGDVGGPRCGRGRAEARRGRRVRAGGAGRLCGAASRGARSSERDVHSVKFLRIGFKTF